MRCRDLRRAVRLPYPLLVLPLCIGLAGCGSPQSPAELERQQECGSQADREFDKQNRYLMSQEDQSSTPFSSSGLIGIPNKGLSDEYHRDQLVNDCLHSTPTTP